MTNDYQIRDSFFAALLSESACASSSKGRRYGEAVDTSVCAGANRSEEHSDKYVADPLALELTVAQESKRSSNGKSSFL